MLKSVFSIFIVLYLNSTTMAQTKAKLIYIADPMCSWCYGFTNELSKALKNLDNNVEFQLIMGGLRPYNTETMSDLGEFLRGHWKHVEERSGKKFNYAILKNESFVYDTEPPSRAVLVMRQLNPEKEFDFFKAIQTSFYVENKNTNEVETYLVLADKFGVNRAKFRAMFESEAMKQAARKDFENAAAMGVRGFPTVVLKKGEQYFLISNGYTEAKNIISNVNYQLELIEK